MVLGKNSEALRITSDNSTTPAERLIHKKLQVRIGIGTDNPAANTGCLQE